MPNFAPTQEQEEIVNASLTGQNVVVEAGAGSGKTSTLKLIAEALPGKSIAYIAFNRVIAQEAASKMPSNVESKTAHAFAYRSVIRFGGSPFGKRLQAPKISSRDVAALLGESKPLTYRVIENDVEHDRVIKPSSIGYAAVKTVERFCQSADREITYWHVPRQDGLDKPSQRSFADHVVSLANRIWADVQDANGHRFKFDHCHYLKIWELSDAGIKVKIGGRTKSPDVVLYDEAQDANPVVQSVVASQKSQVIVVGDRAQSIYGFTGAVNAMDSFDAPHRLRLTKSFRFGPAIAEVANQLLAMMPDTDMQISGHDPIPSKALTGAAESPEP